MQSMRKTGGVCLFTSDINDIVEANKAAAEGLPDVWFMAILYHFGYTFYVFDPAFNTHTDVPSYRVGELNVF